MKAEVEKLVTNLNAEYVIDIRYLKQGLNNTLVLKEYRIINFNQNAWLKPKHWYTKKSKI